MTSEDQEIERALKELGGLPLKRYCQLTGESANTIHQRKFQKIWVEGRELHKPEGGGIWVNLAAANLWITQRGGSPTMPKMVAGIVAEMKG